MYQQKIIQNPSNIEKYSLNILETIKGTNIFKYIIFSNKKGENKTNYYFYTINNNKLSIKLIKNFKTNYISTFKDFYSILNKDNINSSSIKYKKEYINIKLMLSEIKKIIDLLKKEKKEEMINYWKLQKEEYILTLYNSKKEEFFKYFLPLYFEYIKENQKKYFIKEIKKQHLKIFFNFLYEQNIEKKELKEFFLKDIYKIEEKEYYQLILLSLKYDLKENINLIKIYKLLKFTKLNYTIKKDIIINLLNSKILSKKEKTIFIDVIELNKLNIINNSEIKQKIEDFKNKK